MRRGSWNDEFKVFYSGISLEKFKYSLSDRKNIRRELGIEDTEYVIGNVAIFSKLKNQSFLIRVFDRLKERRLDSKLILVGVGPELERVKKMTKRMGLGDSVLFLGKRMDVEKIYSALDVYAMPSMSEGLSISMCEAQANGLTCIASSGVSRESDISGNVVFLETDSVDEWAAAMEACCRKEKVGILNKFDMKNTVSEICNYYSLLYLRHNIGEGK